MSYKNWKIINENFGFSLGLSNQQNLGAVGSKYGEGKYMRRAYFNDEDLEEEDLEDEDLEDEDDEFDLEGEEGEFVDPEEGEFSDEIDIDTEDDMDFPPEHAGAEMGMGDEMGYDDEEEMSGMGDDMDYDSSEILEIDPDAIAGLEGEIDMDMEDDDVDLRRRS
jgi:hypothetical protein